jgi:flagellar basal body-associated protein FliL
MSTTPAAPTDHATGAPPVLAGAAGVVKAKKMNLVVVLLGGVLLGGGGVAGVWYKKNASHAEQKDDPAKAEADKKEEEDKKRSSSKMFIYKLKQPVTVNLKGSNGGRLFKVGVSMEVTSEEILKALDKLDVQLQDMMNEKFGDLDLSQVDNLAGKTRIKKEIMNDVNDLIDGFDDLNGKGRVAKVFFSEFLISK